MPRLHATLSPVSKCEPTQGYAGTSGRIILLEKHALRRGKAESPVSQMKEAMGPKWDPSDGQPGRLRANSQSFLERARLCRQGGRSVALLIVGILTPLLPSGGHQIRA